jgi:hypothetical protein
MNQLEQQFEELNNDIKFDEINVREKTLIIPAIKHKWVKKLIDAKRELKRLEELKSKAINNISQNIATSASIELKSTTLKNAVNNNDIIHKIDESIKEQKIIIEYFEKIEKIVYNLTYDVKNIIEIIKMETT